MHKKIISSLDCREHTTPQQVFNRTHQTLRKIVPEERIGNTASCPGHPHTR